MSTIPAPLSAQAPATENAAAPRARLDSIDGLRGVACLVVLLYHSCLHFGRSPWPAVSLGPLHFTQERLFAYGYGGVDLFFVLSGFCLAYPIVTRPDRPVDWKRYAVHRVRRIIPPYWAALALFALLSLLIAHFRPEPIYSQRILEWTGLRPLFYSALLVSFTYNTSFWTLPVEWRWYFVLPALIWLWRRIGPVGVLLCLIGVSLTSLFFYMPSHQEHLKFLVGVLPMFMPLFGLGIWAASLAAQTNAAQTNTLQTNRPWPQGLKQMAPLGILVTAPIVWVYAPLWQTGFSISAAVLRLVTFGPLCFFAVLAATQDGQVKRWLSWRPLVGIGTFSYSLYLIHEPLVWIAGSLVLARHWPNAVQFGCQVVLLPAMMIGLGYLFFQVAEKPWLRPPPPRA